MSATPTPSPAAQAPFTAERWRQFWDAWGWTVITADPALLTETAPWRQTFSSAPPPPTTPAHANPLPVAWENQNDNASGTGYRECCSSSCAMLARYWGKVASDDEYNAIRAKYGDRETLEEQINLGQPVAVGWLHHGSVSAPSGGGQGTASRRLFGNRQWRSQLAGFTAEKMPPCF